MLQDLELNRNVDIYNSKSMNQDGATYQGNTLAVGELTIKFAILGTNKEELRKNRIRISKVFNPKLGEVEIVVGDKKLIAIATELPYLKEDNHLLVEGIVELDVHDPYYLDFKEFKSEIAIWRPTFEFELEIVEEGIEMGYREPSLIVNVFNDGDVPAGMRIVFKADATVINPSLFNVNTREYFKIEDTMVAGDRIVVTTGFQDKRVKLIREGLTSTLYNWDYTSTFMQLGTGDNLFRYDSDEGIDNLSVDIYYTQKYLEV